MRSNTYRFLLLIACTAAVACDSDSSGAADAAAGDAASGDAASGAENTRDAAPDEQPLESFVDGRWVLRVNRAWKGSPEPTSPADSLNESDYEPSTTSITYDVTVSDTAKRVAVGTTDPFSGARESATDERITFDLTEGTFAGGRFVVWHGDGGLEAELTVYGSGRPIVQSERGALERVR